MFSTVVIDIIITFQHITVIAVIMITLGKMRNFLRIIVAIDTTENIL